MIAAYNRLGAAAIAPRAKRKKNPGAYLSIEEEIEFLESFIERAQQGHLTTTQEIQTAFETKVGTSVAPSTIYRLLDRHGWRKLMPRPSHPQANKASREAFKKNFRGLVQTALADRRATDHRPIVIMAADEGPLWSSRSSKKSLVCSGYST